jgi:hypothetical protein
MSKEKQIEEMAKDLQKSEHWYFNDHSVDFELDRKKTAENLYNAGYRKQNKWISVEERLPELYTYVITYDTVSGDVQIDSVLSNGEFVIGYNVTHWMPLPEAPKGGEE